MENWSGRRCITTRLSIDETLTKGYQRHINGKPVPKFR